MPRNHNIRLSESEREHLGKTATKSGQYSLTSEEYEEITVFRKHIKERGINQDDIIEYWDKTKEFSIRVRPDNSKDILTPEYIKEVISSINFNPKPLSKPVQSDEILRVIITDVHVGMETDESGYGLYKQVWNERVLFERLETIIEECQRMRRDFKEIHVIDLGDYADGWNGLTTRGGHRLPQNMSNRKTFKIGVKFKTELYNRLQDLLNCPLVAYNVCNDNHSSDFGYIINEAVKDICNLQNPNITVNNLERFISHYTYGKYCFILTHGKDEAHMKFGFKVKLDPQTELKLLEYIKYYKIDSEFITLEKGDSHQQLLDSTSSERLDYFSYRAMSPASAWVKHNFKLGTSGFTLMTVRPNVKSKGIFPVEFVQELQKAI